MNRDLSFFTILSSKYAAPLVYGARVSERNYFQVVFPTISVKLILCK